MNQVEIKPEAEISKAMAEMVDQKHTGRLTIDYFEGGLSQATKEVMVGRGLFKRSKIINTRAKR